jgi:hypothetical protein
VISKRLEEKEMLIKIDTKKEIMAVVLRIRLQFSQTFLSNFEDTYQNNMPRYE